MSNHSRRVLTNVRVASRSYGCKRMDTMLRKWNAKTIKMGVLKSFASSIEVFTKASQR